MASMATMSGLHLRAPCRGPPTLVCRGPPSPSRRRIRECIPASLGALRRWRFPLPSGQVICRVRSKEDAAERPSVPEDEEVQDLGVKVALSMLKFYKREISPLLPASCRYLPTCSEYSMQAYKKYGVAKGTILTAWRLCRCNPLGRISLI
ncbi:hypothetical protein Taro_019864 [Colocasia esculenta]|uniref:Uncharacterized protein n=1 Tax=Colocasia esculenta TaxID=4460 RepID=A0A843UM43_COLES|nr:hypothetical protein [Colocasia esculenta]